MAQHPDIIEHSTKSSDRQRAKQQGKKKQAHNMLSEIYSWFTEGFETKDLQEAKALIEELNH